MPALAARLRRRSDRHVRRASHPRQGLSGAEARPDRRRRPDRGHVRGRASRTAPRRRSGCSRATGRYRRAVSTFPSLTPVCLSTIATGAAPDVHEIPHLVWWHRGEQRLVEYGSSFGAIRAAGLTRALRDTIVDMNGDTSARAPSTLFEAVEDAGLTPAAINFTCYRGRTQHAATLPGVPPVLGPRRFFFFNLFESDATGAPLAVRNRASGTVDAYAEAVGRWLWCATASTSSSTTSPTTTSPRMRSARRRPAASSRATDDRIRTLVEAAGGLDEFLERYAVVVCSDHGQTAVTRSGPARGRLRRRPRRPRDRLESRRDGLRATTRALWPSGSTGTRPSTSPLSRATSGRARAEELASCVTATSTRIPTARRRVACGSAQPERRRSARLRRARAGSSPTSAAGTTPAAAATAR